MSLLVISCGGYHSLQEKKNTLMKEYSDSKTNMDDLFTIRKNFEQYMGKEMER